jgi:hypothetical protein
MNRALGYLVGLTAVGLCGFWLARASLTSTSEPAPTSPAPFPILSRFELPRDYGYFIGDEIPLTLVIEVSGDVVVDLINLPQKGDALGVFEIRDRHLMSAQVSEGTTIYRASYTLQYFGPTPLTTTFGPLEILYALPEEQGSSRQISTYKRLVTQPAIIHMARIGPMRPSHAATIKGPLDDQRSGVIWTFLTLGTVLVGSAVGGWGRIWYCTRYRSRSAPPLSVAARAFQQLQHEAPLFFRPLEEPHPPAIIRLEQIVRTYIQAEYEVPAFTLTTAELSSRLNGALGIREVLRVLEQCDALKYQPPDSSPEVERQLWWATMMWFEKKQEEGQQSCPLPTQWQEEGQQSCPLPTQWQEDSV